MIKPVPSPCFLPICALGYLNPQRLLGRFQQPNQLLWHVLQAAFALCLKLHYLSRFMCVCSLRKFLHEIGMQLGSQNCTSGISVKEVEWSGQTVTLFQLGTTVTSKQCCYCISFSTHRKWGFFFSNFPNNLFIRYSEKSTHLLTTSAVTGDS